MVSGTFAVACAPTSPPGAFPQRTAPRHRETHRRPDAKNGNVKILTSCPSCQQGLARYSDATGLDTDYIGVELAKHRFGESWSGDFIERVKNGGVERVLL